MGLIRIMIYCGLKLRKLNRRKIMTNPICKVADIIYVRFELTEFEAQKKYLNHFGMMLAHEDENSIFFRGTGTSPYIYVATKGKENKYFPPIAKMAANNIANTMANLFKNWAIFLLLVFANQFKNK